MTHPEAIAFGLMALLFLLFWGLAGRNQDDWWEDWPDDDKWLR